MHALANYFVLRLHHQAARPKPAPITEPIVPHGAPKTAPETMLPVTDIFPGSTTPYPSCATSGVHMPGFNKTRDVPTLTAVLVSQEKCCVNTACRPLEKRLPPSRAYGRPSISSAVFVLSPSWDHLNTDCAYGSPYDSVESQYPRPS